MRVRTRVRLVRGLRRGGKDELGTTGSGNHFIEVQVVNKIFDANLAKRLGIEQEGQVMVLIHTGSRGGLGHQVATDYIRIAENKMKQWNLFLPDRELAAMPLTTREAQDYLAAMKPRLTMRGRIGR